MPIPNDNLQKVALVNTESETSSANRPEDQNPSFVGKATIKGEAVVSSSSSVTPSVDASDVKENIFADPEVAAFYAELYEKAQYECRHVFDPNLQWTPQEERRIVRKLDWHVCLWAVSIRPSTLVNY